MVGGSIKDIHQVCHEAHPVIDSLFRLTLLVPSYENLWVWFLTVSCEDKSKLSPALPFESLWKSCTPRVSYLPGGRQGLCYSTPKVSWKPWPELRGLSDTWILGDPVESQRNQMCPHASRGGLGELRSMVMSSLKMGMKIATGTSRAQLKTWSSFIAWIGVSPFGDESIVTSHVKNSSSFTLMCFVLPCESLDNCL